MADYWGEALPEERRDDADLFAAHKHLLFTLASERFLWARHGGRCHRVSDYISGCLIELQVQSSATISPM